MIYALVVAPLVGALGAAAVNRLIKDRTAVSRALMSVGAMLATWSSALGVWLVVQPWLESRFERLGWDPLDYTWPMLKWLLVGWAAGFFLLMLPIAAVSIDREARSRRRIVLASVIVTLLSGTILGSGFGIAGNTSLLRLTRVDARALAGQRNDHCVYYVNTEDGYLWRVSLDGSIRERVGSGPAFETGAPEWRIGGLHIEPVDAAHTRVHMLPSDSSRSPSREWDFPIQSVGVNKGDPLIAATLFGPDAVQTWSGGTHFTPHGIRVTNRASKNTTVLGLEAPFLVWSAWDYFWKLQPAYLTILDGGLVVCQIGNDPKTSAIMLIDPDTRRSAILARGSLPVVSTAKPEQLIQRKRPDRR